jgi:hypothetical protein
MDVSWAVSDQGMSGTGRERHREGAENVKFDPKYVASYARSAIQAGEFSSHEPEICAAHAQ